jgi:membrane-anchored protein YejM (alkaline phosphatase superfamily)
VLAEERCRASYSSRVPQSRSSVLVELGWLAYFVVVFVVILNVLLALLVRPHNFSEMIAVVLAGMFSALIMIGTRALWRKR